MATHTNNGGGIYGRKFSISRENGQADKNGRPFFFEWLKELPENKGQRKFETRTNANGAKHYELFAALDGHLIGIEREEKDFSGKPEHWLVLLMADGPEDYRIDIGRIDSRYSMDLMKRLLDPNFHEMQKLRLAPFSMKNDKGGYNIGVSAYSGPDGKLEAKRECAHLQGMPEPDKREWKGEIEYNFLPVANWLFDQISAFVIPRLMKDPVSAPQAAPAPTPRQTTRVSAGGDDWPTVDVTSPTDEDLPF